MGLQRYKEKRNFGATPEPAGKVARRGGRSRMFVIQKHDATRLHYDFRLELDGVLVSWAVPKGIPTQKADRRLAMHVEDHPIDYGGFEGVIPEGNYGAGSVMVWDTGTWEPVGDDPEAALRDGKLKFTLDGKKLKGEWTLVRMRAREKGKDEWLLIKSDKDVPAISARRDDQSVLTGRTMARIADEKTRTWQSNRSEAASVPAGTFKQRIAAAVARRGAPQKKAKQGHTTPTASRARSRRPPRRTPSKDEDDTGSGMPPAIRDCPAEEPRFHEPMKARLVERLPAPGEWTLELKHDGYRALAVKRGREVEIFSRSRKLMNASFPSIVEAIRRLAPDRFVIDGEIVALGERGQGSFQLLQNRERMTDERCLVFYVFDMLNDRGRDVRNLPLETRRAILEKLVREAGDPIRFSAPILGEPQAVLAEVKRLGLEGIIAKKPKSRYETGQRSGSWIKLKCVNEQEFVIGGHTPPQGSRDFFGALLVGYYEKGRLMFASKVGSGYTQAVLRALFQRFKPLRRPDCPFVNLPTRRSGRFGQGVTASEMRRCTWIEPTLVAQVRFTEWTSDGGLRHPVFLGLREDKRPAEVVREMAEA